MKLASFLLIVSCLWACEEVDVFEKKLMCCNGEMCIYEEGPCVKDWIGVCGDG